MFFTVWFLSNYIGPISNILFINIVESGVLNCKSSLIIAVNFLYRNMPIVCQWAYTFGRTVVFDGPYFHDVNRPKLITLVEDFNKNSTSKLNIVLF